MTDDKHALDRNIGWSQQDIYLEPSREHQGLSLEQRKTKPNQYSAGGEWNLIGAAQVITVPKEIIATSPANDKWENFSSIRASPISARVGAAVPASESGRVTVINGIFTQDDPQVFTVFVRIKVNGSYRSIHSEHFEVVPHECFGSILQRFLAKKADKESEYADLQKEEAVVFYQKDRDDSIKSVRASLVDTCRAMQTLGAFLTFVFTNVGASPRDFVPASEVLRTMMRSANAKTSYPELILPTKEGNGLSFDLLLFNWIVKKLQAEGLGVSPGRLAKLTILTKALRNLLQYADVLSKKFPQWFRHQYKKARNRTRLEQEKLNQMSSKLRETMSSLSDLLATNQWSSFNSNLKDLLQVVEAKSASMDDHAKRVKSKQANPVGGDNEELGNRLAHARIVEKKESISAKYVSLAQLLLGLNADYSGIMVTDRQIDEWDPPNSSDEKSEARRQRHKRFRDNVQLPFAVSVVHFKPGGQRPDVSILWKVPDDPDERSLPDNMNAEKKVNANMALQLPQFYRRADWTMFKEDWGFLFGGSVAPGVLRMMWKDLVKDSSSAHSNEEYDRNERVLSYCVSHGCIDLWPDLRALINGNKGEKYAVFFEAAEKFIEQISGAAENRHGSTRTVTSGNAHLVSVPALYDGICKELDASPNLETRAAPRPSKQLLAISLCPRNASRQVAKHFRPRLPVTRAIQKATMRKTNIDCHYNHKCNKNANSLCIELNDAVYSVETHLKRPSRENGLVLSKGMLKVSGDDKSTVPVGEPGYPIRTGVRAKSATLVAECFAKESTALDHDFHRGNVRPTFSLWIRPPPDVDSSWRNGMVHCTLKDAATQVSTGFRHAVEMVKQIETKVKEEDAILSGEGLLPKHDPTSKPYTMLLRTDGGGDRNPKNGSVQIAAAYIFHKLNLDALVMLTTARDVSHVNEVENVMAVANCAFQHQAFARESMSKEMEQMFKSDSCGKKIRTRIASQASPIDIDAAQAAWRGSLRPVMDELSRRLSVSYFGRGPVSVTNAATDEELELAWKYMRDNIDETLDPAISKKSDIEQINTQFCSIMETHGTQERYLYTLRKCGKHDCNFCQKVRMSKEDWDKFANKRSRLIPLPTPVKNQNLEDAGVKYMTYDETKNIETSAKHLPSYTPPTKPTKEAREFDKKNYPGLFVSNNVRHFVQCSNCGKRRCVFAFPRTDGREFTSDVADLEGVISDDSYEFMCGDNLFGLEDKFGLEDEEYRESYPQLTTQQFRVKTALTCGMPMEIFYFTSRKALTSFVASCAICGSDDYLIKDQDELAGLLNLDPKNKGKKSLPFCQKCRDKGVKLLCHGSADKTGSVIGKEGVRKKGSATEKRKPTNVDTIATPNLKKARIEPRTTLAAARKKAKEEKKVAAAAKKEALAAGKRQAAATKKAEAAATRAEKAAEKAAKKLKATTDVVVKKKGVAERKDAPPTFKKVLAARKLPPITKGKPKEDREYGPSSPTNDSSGKAPKRPLGNLQQTTMSGFSSTSTRKEKALTSAPRVVIATTLGNSIQKPDHSSTVDLSIGKQCVTNFATFPLLGLPQEEQLRTFGTLIDVKGDGNCGFYAAKLGLEEKGIIMRGTTITSFRSELYTFAKDNQATLFGDINETPAMKTVCVKQNANNELLAHYPVFRLASLLEDALPEDLERSRRDRQAKRDLWWKKNVLDCIFQIDTDYENGTKGKDGWFHAHHLVPIIVQKYRIAFVVYHPKGDNESSRTDAYSPVFLYGDDCSSPDMYSFALKYETIVAATSKPGVRLIQKTKLVPCQETDHKQAVYIVSDCDRNSGHYVYLRPG